MKLEGANMCTIQPSLKLVLGPPPLSNVAGRALSVEECHRTGKEIHYAHHA